MTHERKSRNLSELNKKFSRKKVKNPNPKPSKGIQLVTAGGTTMKVCDCGSKQFDRNTDACIICGK